MDDDEFGDLYTDVLTNFPSSNPTVAATPIDVNPVQSIPNSNFNSISDSIRLGNLKPSPPPADSPVEEVSIQLNRLEDGIEGAGVAIPPATCTVNDDNSESSSDSDSEDDLQIVLNDTDPNGIFTDDHVVDEDHKPLVIGGDDATVAGSEETELGEDPSADAAAAAGAKPPVPTNLSLAGHPRPNYAPYHSSFHSQFKYVRPGAAPGNAPGPVRPPMSIPLMAGRGRGDLRPPGLKGPGFWGGPAPPRGLDFTLPSHKTIFEVDIDTFEEKPWKYPGVDVSDYFNFSLNEESWKDYCKQLELTRLESTMQSKIRVYESGRAEQEFDPDLPPELAAAAAINDSPIENADNSKAEGGLGDPAKRDARARPVLLTGRAIQVETGFGERLPSADTRPPRVRDSDSVIEIVLQDSIDDESAGNSNTVDPDNDSERGDEQVDDANEDDSVGGGEDFDENPPGYNVTMKDVAKKRSPPIGSPCDDVLDKEGERSSSERASSDHHSGSKDHDSTENVGSPCKKRWMAETACERSPQMSSGESAHDRRPLGYQREDSADSIERKRSPEFLSLAPVVDAVEASAERKAMTDDDNAADDEFRKGKEDSDVVVSTETSHGKRRIHSTKQQKISRPAKPSTTKDVDDLEDLEVSRSSDTSKATGNGRDHRLEGIDEESKQNGRSAYMGNVKRHHGEGGHDSRRNDLDGRMDMDRNYVSTKGREEYYSHKEWDPYKGNQFHVKPEGVDRRERDYPEARRQRRDEDPQGRRTRVEDPRKQEHGEEMVSRHRRKVTEIDKSDKVEFIPSQKNLENGSWRSYHEKDAGLRYREKDDALKSHHEVFNDHHSKRKKDDDFMRRDHVDNQEMSRSLREGGSTRGKRDKEGLLNQRKRDDHLRVRDAYDDHHTARLKDEVWAQRERAEQQRERDEWYRAKQSYEENLSRRDRGERHAAVRSSRAVVEKVWPGHSHGREEYKSYDKDSGRHDEQLKRRERDEEEISFQHRGGESVYTRGNQIVNDSKRPRQDKSTSRNDRASDNQTFREEKLKDNSKKARESEGHTTTGTSKRHQVEKGVVHETGDVKGLSGKAGADHDATSLHNLSREGASSPDEQRDSRRGRSKLERWASHKDRDCDINPKPSSLKSSKSRNVSGSTTVVREESGKKVEVEYSHGVKESGGGSDVKDVDANHQGRVDAAERLKRRRERFKLQLESDPAIKKTENESTPSSQNEAPESAEVKQERPPRKRRWLSS